MGGPGEKKDPPLPPLSPPPLPPPFYRRFLFRYSDGFVIGSGAITSGARFKFANAIPRGAWYRANERRDMSFAIADGR